MAEPGTSTTPPLRRWRVAIRRLLMAAVFAAASSGTFHIVTRKVAEANIRPGYPPMIAAVLIKQHMKSLPGRAPGSPTRIGFLGDSTVQGYPEGLDVATQFGLALEARRPGRFEVVSFAEPGMGALEYYALAEPIVDSDVEILVISFNIASLSTQARDFWARRALVGWIPPSRIPQAAAMPLHWWGITLDRLLVYVAAVQADLVDPWFAYRAFQLRAGNAVETVRRRLQGIEDDRMNSLPAPPFPYHPTVANRFSRPFVLQNLGDAADGAEIDHPVFKLLGGAIDIFRANGIEVFVYATPTNVDHMERVGIDTRAGIRTTIENLETVATSHGARFLDLHRIFPDKAFRDPGNHLTYEGEFLGPQELGRRVADWFERQYAAASPRTGS